MNRARPTIMAASAAWVALAGAVAGAEAAEVTGVLRGESGDERYAIPDAQLTFCREDEDAPCFSTITSSRGWFRFADIPAGTYRITTESRTGGTSAGTLVVPRDGVDSLSIVAR